MAARFQHKFSMARVARWARKRLDEVRAVYDSTPLAAVTRCWIGLTAQERDEQARRLLAGGCSGAGRVHVERPGLDEGRCYARVVAAAVAGDEVAVGWLATTHRPLLIARGRALLEHDPAEWEDACLEILFTAAATVRVSEPRWLRRNVAQAVTRRLSQQVRAHLTRRRHEQPTGTALWLERHAGSVPGRAGDTEAHAPVDLSASLAGVLDQLDPLSREALQALADRRPLAEVADRHGLTYAGVRKRIVRARKVLQPQLERFHRSVA